MVHFVTNLLKGNSSQCLFQSVNTGGLPPTSLCFCCNTPGPIGLAKLLLNLVITLKVIPILFWDLTYHSSQKIVRWIWTAITLVHRISPLRYYLPAIEEAMLSGN